MNLDIHRFTLRDLTRPEILADPYPVFRLLRLEDPVHQDPSTQGWLVTRFDDVATVLSDRRFSAERAVERNKPSHEAKNPVLAALARQMLFLDPPDHTRLRGLFTKAFTPLRLELLRPQILQMTTDLLDAAEQSGGRIDFTRDIAVPLPVSVIAQMLGVPEEDWHRMRSWSVAFGSLISGRALTPEESLEAQRGIVAFIEYFRELIEVRRRKPENDMLSDLVAVEEMGERLNTQELIVNLILLLAAGHGTTTHLLGNGLIALLNHPTQWQLLIQSNETVVPSAVTELLRFDAPVQATSRVAVEDIQLGGKTIAQGQRVTVLLGSANRDEEHFVDPDTLDLHRVSPRILSFGHGIHTCLGAALARMEAQVVFAELPRRFPKMHIEVQTFERAPSISFRGVRSLPVKLN